MIKHYFTLAIRQLTKDKTRTFISVLGITAGLLCFSVCNYYYRTMSAGNKVFDTYERLAELKTDQYSTNFSTDILQKIGKEEFEEVAIFSNFTMNVTLNENTYCRTKTTQCNRGYFKAFSPKCVAGSIQPFDIGQKVAVVTTNFVRTFCNGTNPIGQTLQLPNGNKMNIIAVIEPYPAGMNFYPTVYDMFIPYENEENMYGQHKFLLYRPEDAARITQRLSHQNIKPDDPELSYRIVLDSEVPYRPGMEVWIGCVGLLVLLVGLINFYSLNINSFLARTRELSMRYTLGGRKRDLFAMLYLEQSILLIVATLLVLTVSEVCLPVLISSLPVEAREELAINTGQLSIFILQYLGALLLISALVVLVTVYISPRKSLIQGLKGVGKSGRSNHFVRNTSLGIQFFFSLFFIIATAGVWLQMRELSRQANPGMSIAEKQAVASIKISMYAELMKNLDLIKHKVSSYPWCTSIASKSSDYIRLEEQLVEVVFASDTYFEMMHLDKRHQAGEQFCYINTALHADKIHDSIPEVFSYYKQEYPITGIIHFNAPSGGRTERVAILPLTDERPADNLYIQIRSDTDRLQVKKDLEAILNPYLPVNAPLEFTTLYDEQRNIAVNILMWLFVVCAIICLSVTVLGIYGAITIDTTKRQKEVAIRKISGATLRHVYWLFGRTYLIIYLVTASCTVGITLFGMIMGKQARVLLIDYTSPVLWIFPLFISALIIVLTISWRIYKIFITNPTEAIVNE